MSLADWAKNGWLRTHKPTKEEISILFTCADWHRHLARSWKCTGHISLLGNLDPQVIRKILEHLALDTKPCIHRICALAFPWMLLSNCRLWRCYSRLLAFVFKLENSLYPSLP
jgi:hypothetical protein